jgi:outer membrane receptor protein involved in Fe transport
LNELYRPFRLGNTTTEANAALTPEELYGAEIGAGGAMGALNWSATAFFNQLHDAVTNVTLAPNLLQRQNAGDINAPGVEVETHYAFGDRLSLRAAFDLVDAHVDGSSQAPQLTGLRPSQASRWTVTAGFDAVPLVHLSFNAQLRFESTRFADDQNLLPLPAATTVDARLAYALTENFSVYVAGDNLLNAAIATTESSDGVVSYDQPRLLSLGASLKR